MSIDKFYAIYYMQAFFDSPETIRNKIKEFKTATFNGLNRQDVMNYLSQISEQQGVMIRLLRENNIPLFVDDGYAQEEQFVKPSSENDLLNQFLGNDNSAVVSELQAEIETLKAENAELRLATNDVSSTTSFDTQFNIDNGSEDVAILHQTIEAKELYIKELEEQLQASNNSLPEFNLAESNTGALTDVERQAYEEEILNLRTALENAQANVSATVETDLFNSEVVTIDEDVKASYEREIDSLRQELNDLSFANKNSENTINGLNSTIAELKSELAVCHELIEESSQSQNTKPAHMSNFENLNSNSVDDSTLSDLKTTIEVLELEISKKDREKSNVELQLEELTKELSKFKNFKDEDGRVISLDPVELSNKHKELLSAKASMKAEQEKIDAKIKELKEMEALIESNKHLVSEDYVNSITKKEHEVDRLRKQMDRMLSIAQETADATEKEANENAAKLIEEANSKAQAILDKALNDKETMINDANTILNSAKEFKSSTEEELAKFREDTRTEAENLILEAETKATEVIEAAQEEAQKTQAQAIEEVEKIMAQAEKQVAEIDAKIQSKQKEIDNMQTYYLKVKSDGLVAIKKLYNQLENIIYSDEIS